MKIASILGARPQFIKLAPLIRTIQNHNKSNSNLKIEHLIIHTGQHYDYKMNKIFFDELSIPDPDYNLEVGSGSHGWQTGEIIRRAEKVLMKEKPIGVLVYGDTNSTLAGALAAAKLHISVAHIEAGLRSYNRKMPEETNRVLTDHCSDILFCPTENAVRNLKKESFTNIINNGKLINSAIIKLPITNYQSPIVINVGDIMLDSLLMSLEISERKSTILEKLKLRPKEFYLATVHRAENTNDKEKFQNIFEAFIEISKEKPVVFPIHPRTKKNLKDLRFASSNLYRVLLIGPVSYFDMIILEKNAKKMLTDSGGLQKEGYLLEVPCVTLRNETEWIETIKTGWNVLAGSEKEKILECANKITNQELKNKKQSPIFGDGKAAERIVEILLKISCQLVFKTK